MSKFSQVIIALCLLAMCSAIIAFPAPVRAQIGTQTWTGVCVGGTSDLLKDVPTIRGLQCLIANVLSVVVTVIGLAGFVMVIFGSFKFMLSGTNAKGTEEGKNTITFAVIGLVVALSAYFILNLVSQFTGVSNLLQFRIGLPDASQDAPPPARPGP